MDEIDRWLSDTIGQYNTGMIRQHGLRQSSGTYGMCRGKFTRFTISVLSGKWKPTIAYQEQMMVRHILSLEIKWQHGVCYYHMLALANLLKG